MEIVATLSLKIDGEYLAYAAMKSALEAIVAMEDDWSADKADAVHEAEVALAIEGRLGEQRGYYDTGLADGA